MKRLLLSLIVAISACAKVPQPESAVHVKTRVTCTGDIADQRECNNFWNDAVESGYINDTIPAVNVEVKKFEVYDGGHTAKMAAFKVDMGENTDSAWGHGLYLTLEIGEHDEEQYDDQGNVKVDYKGDTEVVHIAGSPVTSFMLNDIGVALDEDRMKGFPQEIKDWLPTMQKLGIRPITEDKTFKELKDMP